MVGCNTSVETSDYISMTPVRTGVSNDGDTREVTCGYKGEHEYGTHVTYENDYHSQVTQELIRVNK